MSPRARKWPSNADSVTDWSSVAVLRSGPAEPLGADEDDETDRDEREDDDEHLGEDDDEHQSSPRVTSRSSSYE